MAELPWFEADETSLRKMFFALRPPPAVGERLADLGAHWRRRLGRAAPVTPAARLHVSLNSLGAHRRLPQADVRRATAAVSALRAQPFTLAFNRLGGWGRGEGARPVVLWGDEGVIGADLLHETLEAALAAARLPRPRPRPFCAHLTLWRAPAATPEIVIPPVGWRVDELVLLASVHGEGRHEVLGR
jgi:2'-5' RNA ligase